MEWFDVKEIGFTLLIGSFTILGLDAILHYCLNVDIIGFFEGRLGFRRPPPDGTSTAGGQLSRSKEASVTLAVFLAFALGIGVLFEDFSRRSVLVDPADITTIPSKLSPQLARTFNLPPEEDSPVVTLIQDRANPQPGQLAFDLAKNEAFGLHGSPGDLRVQGWLQRKLCLRDPGDMKCEPPKSDPTPDDFARSIRDLYFVAKNNAYAQKNYFDELRTIQARYEFLGTLAVLSFFYFSLAIVIGVPSGIVRFRKTKRGGTRHQRLDQLRGIPVVIIIFLAIYLFSLWGFALEDQAFNLRTFGYFSTKLIMEKQHPVPATPATNQSSPAAQSSPSPQHK